MVVNKLFRTLMFAPPFYWGYLVLFGSLGADPAKNLNHKTGEMALYFLLANLLVGVLISFSKAIPFRWPSGLRFLLQERRWLGVITFFFLIFHLVLYWAMEGFEQKGFEQMYTKNYLIFGTLAWLILLTLAVTSNNFSVRRIGGKKWKNLHRLVYVASLLITFHVLSIEKTDLIKYGSLFAGLWLLQISRAGYLWLKRTKSRASHEASQ